MVFLSPPHKGPGLNWWESEEEMVRFLELPPWEMLAGVEAP